MCPTPIALQPTPCHGCWVCTPCESELPGSSFNSHFLNPCMCLQVPIEAQHETFSTPGQYLSPRSARSTPRNFIPDLSQMKTDSHKPKPAHRYSSLTRNGEPVAQREESDTCSSGDEDDPFGASPKSHSVRASCSVQVHSQSPVISCSYETYIGLLVGLIRQLS